MATAVVVTSDSALMLRLSAMLEGVATVATAPPALDAVELMLKELDPRVVFVDAEPRRRSDRPLGEILATIRRIKPDQHVIAIGEVGAPQKILAAIRVGANDYLDEKCTAEELRERTLKPIAAGAPHAARHADSVVMILSGRPNDGESFVAMHLAAARAKQRGGADTVLIDFNLPISECETAFNLALTYTVADALGDLPRLDRTLLTSALAHDGATGLYFLPLATAAKSLSLPSSVALAALFDTLAAAFGETIVNVGCLRHSDMLGELLPLASQLVVVTTQSLSSIRCCSDVLRQVRAHGLAAESEILVVCDFDRGVEPGADKIARALEMTRTITLPSDRTLLLNALNEGVLPMVAHPGSGYARALDGLVRAIYDGAGTAPRHDGHRLRRLLGGLRCLAP